jgi:hypothetical protein
LSVKTSTTTAASPAIASPADLVVVLIAAGRLDRRSILSLGMFFDA